MDYSRIQIDSIGIGLVDYKDVDLTRDDNFINSYLAIGETIPENAKNDTNNLNHIYDFIVAEKHIGINASRNEFNILENGNNKCLLINGNVLCNGIIHAENIMIDTINTSSTLAETLNRLSSHQLFYPIRDYLQNNIYTNYNLTIGHKNNANNNTNALKISHHSDGNIANIQFVIENNDITDLITTKFSSGIIGNTNEAPMHFITSKKMPIHFNISKTNAEIDNLYIDTQLLPNDRRQIPTYNESNYPSLALDINGTVLINIDKQENQISYNNYNYDGINITKETIQKYPEFYVNGTLFSKNILIYDYITKSPQSIDSIYVRTSGLSLKPNQIEGGIFNKSEFFFTSNIYIGNPVNNNNLKVNGNAEITNTITTTKIITNDIEISNNFIIKANNDGSICDFNRKCNFSAEVIFNDDMSADRINVKTLDISSTGALLVDGCNILPLLTAISVSNPQITNPQITLPQLPLSTSNMNISGILNIGEPRTEINNNILNIYKHPNLYSSDNSQFQIFLYDISKSLYNASKAYIGHTDLNILRGQIDNSLVFLTENNATWNNIYFYAGKNKSTIKNEIPNLAILENSKIGINTINPEKTLDINGDIISTNYYIRQNQNIYECELPIIYNNTNNISSLDINIPINNNNNNKKKLNIIGGINSYDGYYENSYKLCSFKYFNNSNAWIANTNIGIGVSNNDNNITIPLQIKNSSLNQNSINNSVICFYRGNDRSFYSGIEFCDDITNSTNVNKNKWYIYKNHITDDENFVGPLQFGYIDDDYEPNKSCINIYYNTNNSKYFIDINNDRTYKSYDSYLHHNNEIVNINGNVKINGDIDIDGSINISGNYKFKSNNIIFVPNLLTTTINKIYSIGNDKYYIDTILTPNGAYTQASNIFLLSSNVNYNINNVFFNVNSNINIINSSNNSNISLTVFNITSNITSNINNYSSIITNYNTFSNITSLYTNIILGYKSSTRTNQTEYYYLYNDITKNILPNDFNIIKTNSSNNLILASNIYITTSNIYNNISNISKIINNYSNIAENNLIISSNIYNSSSNIDTIIKNSYNSFINPLANDIINIITTSDSNLKISQNLYNLTSNYKNNISNFYNANFPNIETITSNQMINTSNIYILTSNIYINEIKDAIITTNNIIKYSHSNALYADNIYSNVSNITNYINDYYPLFNSQIITTDDLLPQFIQTSNNSKINYKSTNKIYLNLTNDFNSYISKSSNNFITSRNNSNIIISYNKNEPVLLTSYSKEIITSGIINIYNDTFTFKNNFEDYKQTAHNILNDYNYLLTTNIDINNKYNINKNNSTIAINIFNELINDIIYLQEYSLISNYNNGEFLARSESLTNKYIELINKSYDFANSFKIFGEIMNEYIGNNIGNSRTLIDILNIIIETTNLILNDCWEASKIIVKYVSISFSMNAIIKENNLTIDTISPQIDTDVIITGNSIKLYPSTSIFIGYDRNWYSSIQDTMISNPPLYIYNDKPNIPVSVFSNKGDTFSTTTGQTTIVANSKIDINIIDASIYNDDNSIIEGVSLSLSSIRNRTTINEPSTYHKLTSKFEIKTKNSAYPFFNCYKTDNDINIFNIGSGNFYNPITKTILKSDNVVHINDSTSSHLLRLTNNSINPVSIDIIQNNINNWNIKVNENYKYTYNSKNILNIHSNGILINENDFENDHDSSLYINSFSNIPALLLKNNYISSSQSPIIKQIDLLMSDFNYNYTSFGLIYNLKNLINDYDIEYTSYILNENILFNNLIYEIFRVSANYADTITFDFTNITDNSLNLLPFIKSFDTNISFEIKDYIINNITISLGNATSIIKIKIPSVLNSIYTSTITYNITKCNIITNIREISYDITDYGSIELIYNTKEGINVTHTILYNKYSSFIINNITSTVNTYIYHISRNNYLIPSAITNNFTSTITSNINNNNIDINNRIEYLKPQSSSSIITNIYNEIDEKLYTTNLFGKKYILSFVFKIKDIYDVYSLPNNINISQRFIKNNVKLPLIKQKNIYGNFHNIYSYTNDYELYFNDYKLLNIDKYGTLNTSGNIETNNIYIKGDIYNKDGVSLYDNILSLFTNNKLTHNFELNTKNIILNANSYNRDNYKGCVLINGGNDINPDNNNMFQINNFIDNDNFITLNSCTQNSYIHFNTKIQKYNKDVNSIYRLGTSNNIFGIWNKIINPNLDYNKNYYIDTSISSLDIYRNTMNIHYDNNHYHIYNNGSLYSQADSNIFINKTSITNALSKISNINGYIYNSINDINIIPKKYTGLLAQEVAQVLPEAVSISEIDGTSNISYGNMIGLLVECIKELKNKIETLETALIQS